MTPPDFTERKVVEFAARMLRFADHCEYQTARGLEADTAVIRNNAKWFRSTLTEAMNEGKRMGREEAVEYIKTEIGEIPMSSSQTLNNVLEAAKRV